jgi:alanyl-tRNA synthetase
MKVLDGAIKTARGSGDVIDGATVFKLYDTFGFPVDLTADVAREHELTIDMEGFEREMEAQRQRARQASRFGVGPSSGVSVDQISQFTGYDRGEDEGRVIALYQDGQAVDALEAGAEGMVFLDVTPFYAEAGGQVGDSGELIGDSARFRVDDTRKQGQASAHLGTLESGRIELGAVLRAHIDEGRRSATRANHSATHLLHAALRHVLGTHVQQKGSLVHPEYLRFDFSHFEPVTHDELIRIERFINDEIRRNSPTEVREMSMEDAQAEGAMALFGEKYGDQVRVLRLGPQSLELCGGTHVERTGDIGLCKIVSETGVAAGVRRIEALSGARAIEWVEAQQDRLGRIAHQVNAGADEVEERVGQIVERSRRLEKEVGELKGQLAQAAGGDLAEQAVEIGGLKVVAARLDGSDAKTLRDTVDRLKNRLGSAAVLVATVNEGKVQLAAGVTSGDTDRLKAGDLVNFVASQVGGRGGGRPDMAQAGGDQPEGLDEALAGVPDWIRQQLG